MPPVSNSLSTDLYELNMVQAYLDRGENKEAVFEFFVRRLPARRGFLLAAGLGRRARLSRGLALFRRRHRLAEKHRPLPGKPDRLSARLPFHRRRACDAGRQRLLCQRAAVAHHRAAAAGATGRDPADQHSAFPDADRLEGGAHGAGGARQGAVRFRPAHRARRRGRAVFGARELPRRLCRRRQCASRRALRRADRRHHGAFLRAGARRRGAGLREFRARAARTA